MTFLPCAVKLCLFTYLSFASGFKPLVKLKYYYTLEVNDQKKDFKKMVLMK
jgi:hypothetical protein